MFDKLIKHLINLQSHLFERTMILLILCNIGSYSLLLYLSDCEDIVKYLELAKWAKQSQTPVNM